MGDPNPVKCPLCKKNGLERIYEPLTILYPGRPAHTYNDVKKFKVMTKDGGPAYLVDPNKHGDLGSWHTDVKPAPKKKKK